MSPKSLDTLNPDIAGVQQGHIQGFLGVKPPFIGIFFNLLWFFKKKIPNNPPPLIFPSIQKKIKIENFLDTPLTPPKWYPPNSVININIIFQKNNNLKLQTFPMSQRVFLFSEKKMGGIPADSLWNEKLWSEYFSHEITEWMCVIIFRSHCYLNT